MHSDLQMAAKNNAKLRGCYVHFVNVSDLVDRNWRFLEPINTDPNLSWSMHYGRPSNFIERKIKRPNIGRYRSAWSAVRETKSREDAVLVSHLPLVSAACNRFLQRLCPQRPHIAFSFNFTELPGESKKARISSMLRGIDAYVVYSRYEVELYSRSFDIPKEKIVYLPWAMDAPHLGASNPVAAEGEYFCSVGGEGRDYALLARAMEKLPQHKLIIIARPHSVKGLKFPDNVKVFLNLPSPLTWRIVADSQGLIVPLRDEETACGHITIVGGQLLGKPVIATQSVGISDYITTGQNGFTVSGGDVAALVNSLEFLQQDQASANKIGQAAKERANRENNPSIWLRFFEDFAERLVS